MKAILTILFVTLGCLVVAQTRPVILPAPNAPQGYYKIGWVQADSGLIAAKRDTTGFLPRFSGTIVMRPQNRNLYMYDSVLLAWKKILFEGDIAATTWGSITGSLSNQTDLKDSLNKRIDSLFRRSDSVFAFKGGVPIFQFKDSSGAEAFIQNGNSFGDTARLGTNDNFGLLFKTNNQSRGILTSSGFLGIGTLSPASKIDITTNSLGTAQTTSSGLLLANNTLAQAGSQQVSPAIRFLGSGWKTNATAAAQSVEYRAYMVPTQGAGAPSSYFVFERSIAGGPWMSQGELHPEGWRIGDGGGGGISFSGVPGSSVPRQTILTPNALAVRTGGIPDPLTFSFVATVGHAQTTGRIATLWVSNGNPGFNPTSGNANYSHLLLTPLINQTGSSNGTSRGIYIAPTIISAVDFRSIQIDSGKIVTGTTVLPIIPSMGGNDYVVTYNQVDSSWKRILATNLPGGGGGGGSVSSFTFTDGSGFVGGVLTPTTTPTLSLTTSLTTTHIPVIGSSGSLTGSGNFTFTNPATDTYQLNVGTAAANNIGKIALGGSAANGEIDFLGGPGVIRGADYMDYITTPSGTGHRFYVQNNLLSLQIHESKKVTVYDSLRLASVNVKSGDTTLFKPLGIDASGNVFQMGNWTLGTAFIQNGNSFGATAVLGTNDAQQLNIRTNSTTRMAISSSGLVGVNTDPLAGFQMRVRGNPGRMSSMQIDSQSVFSGNPAGLSLYGRAGTVNSGQFGAGVLEYSFVNANTNWRAYIGVQSWPYITAVGPPAIGGGKFTNYINAFSAGMTYDGAGTTLANMIGVLSAQSARFGTVSKLYDYYAADFNTVNNNGSDNPPLTEHYAFYAEDFVYGVGSTKNHGVYINGNQTNYIGGKLWIGSKTDTAHKLNVNGDAKFSVTDVGNNTVPVVFKIEHQTISSPMSGFGVEFAMYNENTAGTITKTTAIRSAYNDATSGSEDADFLIRNVRAGTEQTAAIFTNLGRLQLPSAQDSTTTATGGFVYRDAATGELRLTAAPGGGGGSPTLNQFQIGVGNASNLLSGSSAFVYDGTTVKQENATAAFSGTSTTALGTTSGFDFRSLAKATPTAADQRLGGFMMGTLDGGTTENITAGVEAYSSAAHTPGSAEATNLRFYVTATNARLEAMRILHNGRIGIGTTTPTARMQLPPGTASPSTAPMKLSLGTDNTTGEEGALEFSTISSVNRLAFSTSNGNRRRFPLMNDVTPTAGGILQGNGTDFTLLALGTAGQQPRVNAGGTAVEWFTPSAGVNIYNSDGTLSGSRILSGASNSLLLGDPSSKLNFLTVNAANDVIINSDDQIRLSGGLWLKSSTATDANFTATSNMTQIFLPAITANRTFTLPSTADGQTFYVYNNNTSANNWNIGAVALNDAAGNSVPYLNSSTWYVIQGITGNISSGWRIVSKQGPPAIVTSSASSLTMEIFTDVYVASGSSQTFTLPTGFNGSKTFSVKNRGSNALTILRGGSDQIYDTGAVTSINVAAGAAVVLTWDGTYWELN